MKQYLENKIGNIKKIQKIRGEASIREFYRIFLENYSLVAMVFPTDNEDEISKINHFTNVYKKFHIKVPQIVDIIDNRVVLQEDLDKHSVQNIFTKLKIEKRKKMLMKVAEILLKLRQIPKTYSKQKLDKRRMILEMDFFLFHFAQKFFPQKSPFENLKNEIYTIVSRIRNIKTFAHRDFHSRNMLLYKNDIYMVDYQDSLIAPEYYDLVSFSFDSYLDLKLTRNYFFQIIEKMGLKIDYEQLYLTALQRNIKALGTFGYQVTVNKNLNYKKYINRTIRHIIKNEAANFTLPSSLQLFKSFDFLYD